MFNNSPPRKSCCSWDNAEKYCRARQATDDSMAHARSMLHIKSYEHQLRICNTIELYLSGLIGTASHTYIQKIRIIGFFLKINYIGSLKFVCYYLQYVPASKLFDHAWFEVLEAIVLYCTWSDKLDKFTRRAKPIRITSVRISGVLQHLLRTFPLQQWLHERATVLHFTYIVYTVIPRLTKIIRSGITFVSRNVISLRFL